MACVDEMTNVAKNVRLVELRRSPYAWSYRPYLPGSEIIGNSKAHLRILGHYLNLILAPQSQLK
jgi:hypothetical protein